jgi:hypothetical protein
MHALVWGSWPAVTRHFEDQRARLSVAKIGLIVRRGKWLWFKRLRRQCALSQVLAPTELARIELVLDKLLKFCSLNYQKM